MKKLLLLLVVVFLPLQFSYSQGMAVFDAVLDAVLVKSGIESAIYYAQQIKDNITQLEWLLV